MTSTNLTPRQEKWFASVRAGLERDTGRSLADWVAIARRCPETAHRARLKWFKDNHGLLQNRASQVLSEALGEQMGWTDPEALVDELWGEPGARAIFDAVNARVGGLEGVVRTARKGYTAWSRRVQFAALRPLKNGKVVLGLAVPPTGPLIPAKNQGWSERLTAKVTLAEPAQVNDAIFVWLKAAWDRA